MRVGMTIGSKGGIKKRLFSASFLSFLPSFIPSSLLSSLSFFFLPLCFSNLRHVCLLTELCIQEKNDDVGAYEYNITVKAKSWSR